MLALASAGSLALLFMNFATTQAAYFRGGSTLLTVIHTLPVLAAVATAATVATTVLAWRKGWWTRLGRIHHTTVAVAALTYLAVAINYNVLG
jgi:hypothetical protein